MAGSVKSKIRSGTIFLFLLVVISGGLSIYYLVRLSSNSKNVLRANYESLLYCHDMQKALDSIQHNRITYMDSFEKKLERQEANITEPGETEATRTLRAEFNKFKANDTSQSTFNHLHFYLQQILSLNMNAIKQKAEHAEKAADEALTFLILIIAFIFIVGLTFSYNFPFIITNPIQKLTEAIREIAQKNYSRRIHIQSKDEFGELANAFNDMAERLEYFENSNLSKILFEKSRAEAVINSLKDASIGIDKNGIILFANGEASQLLGMDAKDLVGMPVEGIKKKNDLFAFLIAEKGAVPFKIVVDNRENYFTKEVIDVSQDGSNSKVIVLKNITTYKELDVAKTNFIATVSHELKTPLASSDFSLKLLEDKRIGNLTREQKELILQLKNDNQRMLRILSELLNMSQVEAGKIQLSIQPVNPYQVVQNSISAVENAAKERELHIKTDLPADLPFAKADPDKISWVLNNFLTNAIKHSPVQNDILVSVTANNKGLSFAVSDKGPGIEASYLARIFERYFQVPGRVDKKGSGIGLAICKEFIEAMKGQVWVKSQVGQGSTFGFDIPAEREASV